MFTVGAWLLMAAISTLPHIRTAQPALAAALQAGVERSDLFRELVDRVNESDVVVHVIYDESQAPGLGAHVAFATSAGGVRYVRMSVSPRLNGCDLLAILGHELRHVVEIADEPSVVDQVSMAAFYSIVGERRTSQRALMFDTAAAVAAGERVRREVLGSRRVDVPDRRP